MTQRDETFSLFRVLNENAVRRLAHSHAASSVEMLGLFEAEAITEYNKQVTHYMRGYHRALGSYYNALLKRQQ